MSKKIVRIFWSIISAILILAVILVLAMRFVVLPKISQKLQESGRGELAAIVDQNNNFGSFATISKLLTDKGMIKFISTLDSESASSVIDIIETLDQELAADKEQETKSSPSPTAEKPWLVDETRNLPKATPDQSKLPVPMPSLPPQVKDEATSAYDRIAAAASKKEISDGVAIISKLDMGYVASLLEGGLTSAEKSELYKYIKNKLSKAELNRSIELYNKYKKYL